MSYLSRLCNLNSLIWGRGKWTPNAVEDEDHREIHILHEKESSLRWNSNAQANSFFFFYTDDCSPNADKMSWLGTLKYFKDKRGSRGNRKEPQATPLKEKKGLPYRSMEINLWKTSHQKVRFYFARVVSWLKKCDSVWALIIITKLLALNVGFSCKFFFFDWNVLLFTANN